MMNLGWWPHMHPLYCKKYLDFQLIRTNNYAVMFFGINAKKMIFFCRYFTKIIVAKFGFNWSGSFRDDSIVIFFHHWGNNLYNSTISAIIHLSTIIHWQWSCTVHITCMYVVQFCLHVLFLSGSEPAQVL